MHSAVRAVQEGGVTMRAFIESKHYDDGKIFREIIRTDDIRRIYIGKTSGKTVVIEMMDGTKIKELYEDEYTCLLRYHRLSEALETWRDPFENALMREETTDGGSVHQAL